MLEYTILFSSFGQPWPLREDKEVRGCLKYAKISLSTLPWWQDRSNLHSAGFVNKPVWDLYWLVIKRWVSIQSKVTALRIDAQGGCRSGTGSSRLYMLLNIQDCRIMSAGILWCGHHMLKVFWNSLKCEWSNFKLVAFSKFASFGLVRVFNLLGTYQLYDKKDLVLPIYCTGLEGSVNSYM